MARGKVAAELPYMALARVAASQSNKEAMRRIMAAELLGNRLAVLNCDLDDAR